ncbi:hypothetical protein I6N96_01170 [Enterococcus sp. BWM-S5]|uniref:Phage protein n=1 Tax=Enterococcus larvae TaxID=2794352 RepID=A0ABS4CG00_9ENTE|nr:hypothetical protein [Enterococcus larvae]MBP1044872.1 hypothetical protein [Enterococcus larvae]
MQNMNNQPDHELGWEDSIQQDAPDYVLLTPGDYIFEVTKFERGRYTPGPNAKMPPCNEANLTLKVESPQGEAIIRHRLFLHSSTEGMLSAFFSAIGLKRKGEPTQMNWGAVLGATGACKVKNREYNGNKYNEVQSFYGKDASYYQDKPMPEIIQQLNQAATGYQPPQQNYTQPATQQNYSQPTTQKQPPQQQGGFTPGAF